MGPGCRTSWGGGTAAAGQTTSGGVCGKSSQGWTGRRTSPFPWTSTTTSRRDGGPFSGLREQPARHVAGGPQVLSADRGTELISATRTYDIERTGEILYSDVKHAPRNFAVAKKYERTSRLPPITPDGGSSLRAQPAGGVLLPLASFVAIVGSRNAATDSREYLPYPYLSTPASPWASVMGGRAAGPAGSRLLNDSRKSRAQVIPRTIGGYYCTNSAAWTRRLKAEPKTFGKSRPSAFQNPVPQCLQAAVTEFSE